MHTELSGPVLAPLSDLAAANGNAPDHPVVRHAPAALTLSTPSAVTPFAWAALVSAGSAPPGDSGDLEQRSFCHVDDADLFVTASGHAAGKFRFVVSSASPPFVLQQAGAAWALAGEARLDAGAPIAWGDMRITFHRGFVLDSLVPAPHRSVSSTGVTMSREPRTHTGLLPKIGVSQATPYTACADEASLRASAADAQVCESSVAFIDLAKHHILAHARSSDAPLVVVVGELQGMASSLMLTIAALSAVRELQSVPGCPPQYLVEADDAGLVVVENNLTALDDSIRPLLSAPESRESAATVEQLLQGAENREGRFLDVRVLLACHAELQLRPFDLDRVHATSTDAREPGMINNIRARVQAAGGAPVVVGASCLHVAKLHEHLREEFNVVVVSSFMTGTGDTRVTPFSRQRSSYLLHCKDHKVLALRASQALESQPFNFIASAIEHGIPFVHGNTAASAGGSSSSL